MREVIISYEYGNERRSPDRILYVLCGRVCPIGESNLSFLFSNWDELDLFFNFTIYPVYSRVGRRNLVLRHSVHHFSPNSWDFAYRLAELNASISLAIEPTTCQVYSRTLVPRLRLYTISTFYVLFNDNTIKNKWYCRRNEISNYLIRSGVEAKSGVQFRHLTRSTSRIWQKMLNTRFPGSPCLQCTIKKIYKCK